jgi:hypothetical protein
MRVTLANWYSTLAPSVPLPQTRECCRRHSFCEDAWTVFWESNERDCAGCRLALSYADGYAEWRRFPMIRIGISSGAKIKEQKLEDDVLEVAKS